MRRCWVQLKTDIINIDHILSLVRRVLELIVFQFPWQHFSRSCNVIETQQLLKQILHLQLKFKPLSSFGWCCIPICIFRGYKVLHFYCQWLLKDTTYEKIIKSIWKELLSWIYEYTISFYPRLTSNIIEGYDRKLSYKLSTKC